VEKTWDKQFTREASRALLWIGRRLDTVAALVGGVIAIILVATGGAESPKDLASITLGVLTVVAFSLVVERSLRFKSTDEIAEVRDQLGEIRKEVEMTHQTLLVMDSGTPYQVVESDTTWDIKDDGSVFVKRRKRLRFSQEDVVTVVDWVKGDGTVDEIKYRPSAEGSPIHTYVNDGRKFSLIALDRPYRREEELDFVTERTVKDCFVKTPDRTIVVPLEATSVVKMRVVWPPAHPPRAVRHFRRTDTEREKPSTIQTTPREDGRTEAVIEAQRPTLGERVCIEWDWEPPTPQTAASTNGSEPAHPAASGSPDEA
jgi:hypothetical protein